MDAQPKAVETPTQETQPSLLEILAGGFSEISDDTPLFI